ncbi:MAG: glycosyltransferase family 2 protein [Alphaproteobacteria bacterium]|nr:glycosyltransferase family 2 protein [Alphaproteobacteria bacterium]
MPPTSPDVSVVIPTIGRPALLTRAVASVLAQTLGDLECIVVIDGPDPASVAALARIADPRLRVLVNETSLHVAGTRNRGVAEATGRWVAFLDDDDEWLPEKLAKQRALGGDDPRAIVMTLSRVVTPRGDYVWPRARYDNAEPLDDYLFDRRSWFKGHAFIQTSSLLMPRALFERVRFGAARQHEDWEMLIRLTKREGARILTVPEPLVVHLAEHDRPSLSQRYPWQQSLAWLDALGDLITPRAYSGFLLTILAPQPARYGQYGAFWPLLSRAFSRGSPTLRQLAMFVAVWLVPMQARQAIRKLLSRR